MIEERLSGVMFNCYPDSLAGNLSGAADFLGQTELKGVFNYFYILPSVFNSDLDRGFSVIDYGINEELASISDLARLKELGIELKFDLVLNHLSVGSPQFQDMLTQGKESKYIDFFINWNDFWKHDGEMGPEGYVIPREDYLQKLFMRKPGLPILMVKFPDGSEQPYWNTFYQEVKELDGERTYLGQMDLNAKSDLVWQFYRDTLKKLKDYGARVVRLDAFAYLHKEPGRTNFFNKPETWSYLQQLREIASEYDLVLLPEIHAEYGKGLHAEVSSEGYPIYDFFLPGLLLHAILKGEAEKLATWAKEQQDKGFCTINMLGCHDGIPVLDLKGGPNGETGLLSDQEIDDVIESVLDRGGRVKNLFGPDGKKISYYQVNATYFSALGESEEAMLLARAIQLFMPGTPQVWYLDLFAGVNDHEAVERGGSGNHKEINRTNLSADDITAKMQLPIVKRQLELIAFRNQSQAFGGVFDVNVPEPHILHIKWVNADSWAELRADLKSLEFSVEHS